MPDKTRAALDIVQREEENYAMEQDAEAGEYVKSGDDRAAMAAADRCSEACINASNLEEAMYSSKDETKKE